MLTNKARVLLILSQDVLDQARVLAGKTTTAFKLPVSLQIILRALIEEGLKRENNAALLANIEGQAKAVREIRSAARHAGRIQGGPVNRRSEIRRRADGGRRWVAAAPGMRKR